MKNENDNIVYVNGPEEAEQNNLRIQKLRATRQKIIIAVVVILAVVAIAFLATIRTKEYKGYRVTNSIATNYESTANYINFCGNLLKYTPDGVSYIDAKGKIVWAAGIDMKMPIAVSNGTFAVVADLNGNNVCVFDSTGLVSNLAMPYTICDVDIANQGAFAVVLESQKTNYINLYNKNGEIIYEMQTTLDKSGYPLDISISDDGKKLFTSYINIGATAVENNLAAYNFGDVGQNSNADRMVGGYKFSGQIIPKVEFVNNDVVVGFGTNSINIYDMKEKPSEKATVKYDTEIRSVFYGKDYVGVVRDRNATVIEQPEEDGKKKDSDKNEEKITAFTTETTTEETIQGLTTEDGEVTTEEVLTEEGGEQTSEEIATEEQTENATEESQEEQPEINQTNRLNRKKLNTNDKKLGFKNDKEEKSGKYELIVYDLHGRTKFKDDIDFNYEKVYSTNSEIIVFGGDYCKIYRINGSVKYEGHLSNTIVSIVPTGKHNEYVVVYGDRTDTIVLRTEEGSEGITTEETENSMDEVTTSTTVPTVVSTEKPDSTAVQTEQVTDESTEEGTEEQ